MWEEVARSACEDSGSRSVLGAIDDVTVVYCQSWPYDDAPGRLAERMGLRPGAKRLSGIGGTVPIAALAEAGEKVMRGEAGVSLVVGAEALATLRRLHKEGLEPKWSHRSQEKQRMPFDVPFHPAEVAHRVFEAYLTFALFDSARRARLGRTFTEHAQRIGSLMAPLSRTAASDPANSWFPFARTAEEISNPSEANRMVAFPYTKLSMAVMDVDMAAAFLVASDTVADELGVPSERRVYLRSYAYAEDPPYVAQRRDMSRSEAMRTASRAALEGASASLDDIAYLDLYSCFPSSVSFALEALGLAEEDFSDTLASPAKRSLTLTGGLPYHGGPGSNYASHAIVAAVERLRSDPCELAMVSGVGMHMMKHAFAILSGTPGDFRPCDRGRLAEQVAAAQPLAPIADDPIGDATVAAYSVVHRRDGSAESGVLVCDLPDGSRCYARMEEEADLVLAEERELIGERVRLATAAGVTTARVP
jgi:acetyl-CoA C-acetyltransferase